MSTSQTEQHVKEKKFGPLERYLRENRAVWWMLLVVLVFAGVVITRHYPAGDYPVHVGWVDQLLRDGVIYRPPNDLFQILVVWVRFLLPVRVFAALSPSFKELLDSTINQYAAIVLMVLAVAATSIIVYNRFKEAWKGLTVGRSSKIAILTLSVLVMGPIFIFSIPNRMYFGYVYPNPWHNPTYLLLRLFALMVFFLTSRVLYKKASIGDVLAAAVLILLATKAKPNFTLIFLPALAIYGLMHWQRLKELNWWYVIVGLGLPALGVLAAQYYITYSGGDVDQILFRPLRIFVYFVTNIPTAALYFLLSILFPLMVTIKYWRETKNERSFILAWLAFALGTFLALGFMEKVNIGSLNFWWGSMIGLFILNVETVVQAGKVGLFSATFKDKDIDERVILIVFALQVLCGLIFAVSFSVYPRLLS